jgi:hypothetical protein
MNISSVSSNSAITPLTSAVSTSTVDTVQSPEDSSSMSGPAELFKKLEDLSKSDPTKFKEAVDGVSKKLTEAANAAADPNEKQMLNDLAQKFTQAGNTGDVSSLEPPEGGPPAGGAPPGGAPPGGAPPGGAPPGGAPPGGASSSDSSSSSNSSKTYDPADANQDGKVSMEERMEYDAEQAAKSSPDSTGLSAYKNALHSAAEQKANDLFSSLNAIVDSVATG